MNRKAWIGIGTLIIIFTIITLGCSPSVSNMKEIDIRGQITNVSGNDARKIILIEGQLEKDTKFDKAAVSVTDKTKIYQTDGNGTKPVGSKALTTGKKVEAIFTGPIAESYPVQVTAKEIIIQK